MTLLSLKLFDHCSVGSSVSIDDTTIEDSVYESTIELSPSTSIPLTEDTFVDVSSAVYTTDLVESDIFAIDSSVSDIEVHDTSTHTVDSSSWGFMLNDEGGMSTFDDSHGSTDWFDGDIGISNNCDF